MEEECLRTLTPWREVVIPKRPPKFDYGLALELSGFWLSSESKPAASAVAVEDPRLVKLVKIRPEDLGFTERLGPSERELINTYSPFGLRRCSPAAALECILALDEIQPDTRWEFSMEPVEAKLPKRKGGTESWLCTFSLHRHAPKNNVGSVTCWRGKGDNGICFLGDEYIFELV